MSSKNTPLKHHYIPQFILRNFISENNKLFYYSKNEKQIIKEFPSNIFMEINLNKDAINNKDNPYWIEEELSYFENVIAPLFKKFNSQTEIILTTEDTFRLRIFLFIMMFRSKHVRNEFLKFNNNDISIYELFQKFENSEDLWKKNLGALAKCRNEKDVKALKDVNPVILEKLLIQFTGYYTTVLERRGPVDFILSDVYPTIYFREINQSLFPVCLFFPISPTRLLVLNYFDNDKLFKNDYIITKNICFPPRPYDYNTKSIKIIVKKIYEHEVSNINTLIEENAIEGIVLSTKKLSLDEEYL